MDRREWNRRWYSSFDERRMLLIVETGGEEVEIPAKYEVCGTCDGKGKHVNPSIDSHGLTREDFDEDPDFRENYMSGMYDVSCNECHGNRVVPDIDETRAKPEHVKLRDEILQENYSDAVTYRRESGQW